MTNQSFRNHLVKSLYQVRCCQVRAEIDFNVAYVNGLIGGAFLSGAIDSETDHRLFDLMVNAREIRRQELNA